MDVDSFIAKYGTEWQRLESLCSASGRGLAAGGDIDELVRLYLRASTHLSEARTIYRNAELESYLNALVARAHAIVYSARSRSIGTLARVFGTKYRAAVHRTAPYILVMAGLLVVIVIASALWVAMSRQAQAGILPPAARDAIQRAGGHRANLGIPPPGLATEILLNNVSVAFLAFAFGITLGIGTIWVVVQNALLLGVLAGAFQAAGHGAGFWALILPHGVLELTAICIAAGAGLRIGWSIVAPGDRPRGSALAEEARDAVLVVVGVVPAFGIAAIVEAFVTGTSIPVAAQLALGATLAAGYVLFLFGWRRSPRTLPPRHSRPADLMRR